MPDNAEEAAAIVVAVVGGIAAILTALIAAIGAVVAAWKSKVKPVLDQTRENSRVAAHELQNNSGSSVKDSTDRIEKAVQVMGSDIRQMRDVQIKDRDQANRTNSEIFKRLHELESPNSATERMSND